MSTRPHWSLQGQDADPLLLEITLDRALANRARISPDRPAVYFEDRPTSYGELWRGIERFAAYFRGRGINQGDRVLLSLINTERFFFAFHGLIRLGGVAVPVFPGLNVPRLAQMANLCGAAGLVTDEAMDGAARAELTDLVGSQGFAFFDLAEGVAQPDGPVTQPVTAPDDLAMLQYTSGSTHDPKGVMLTHANLLTNIRQIIPACSMVEADVFVSWLPVFHDMGLITMTMCPFYLGATLVLLSVSPRPFPWLNAIEKYGGTFTAAPDFGYRFCTKFSKAGSHYQVQSLSRGLIAGEPVRASTIQAFERKFGLANVIKPGYGLAEASVGISFWGKHDGPVLIDGEGHVCAGYPLPAVSVAIAEGDEILPANTRGEILIRGANCTAGYYRNPAATADLLWGNGYLRTGDIGYLDDEGRIFIVGRSKNIIIRAGRNLAPREIEEEVERLEDVRLSAAIGLDHEGWDEERLLVFAEVNPPRIKDPAEAEAMTRAIIQGIHTALGLRPDQVALVKPKAIPRTHNGKIKYNQLKADYSQGRMTNQIIHLSE